MNSSVSWRLGSYGVQQAMLCNTVGQEVKENSDSSGQGLPGVIDSA